MIEHNIIILYSISADGTPRYTGDFYYHNTPATKMYVLLLFIKKWWIDIKNKNKIIMKYTYSVRAERVSSFFSYVIISV